MADPRTTTLRLLATADRLTRSAPRPSLLTATGHYDGGAVMRLAHDLARADVADAARRGRVRRYKVALRDALQSAWSTAQTQRWCHKRDAELAPIPAAHAAILVERTAALMIDSTRRMMVELSAIDARAAALGVRL